ncbi:MAG: MaoC family dehydratase N-terminal domain-containing protein [Chloroflexi bacterium]|nr:MaoC family dehydratase N-terminal domain-containing protein [Chloroflexota bacterium]
MSSKEEVEAIAAEWVGRTVGPGEPLEIESGAVRRYAEVIQDENPLYRDPEAAATSIYGGIPMPPGFLITRMRSGGERDFQIPLPVTHRVRGEDAFEFIRPVVAGDTITAETLISGIEAKEGRSGFFVVINTETTYYNQRHEAVLVNRVRVIKR